MYCYVVQPNSVVLEVEVDQKAKGQDVLEKVCDILGIRTEMDYFGLKYISVKNTELWLNLRNPVERKSLGQNNLRFMLKVKFWVPPHLVLQETTRHQMFHQVLAELRSGRLTPQDKEAKLRLAALICQALSNTPVWEFYSSWAEILGTADSGHVIASLHKEMEGMKSSAAEYWVLKEVANLEEFGEEIYEIKGWRIGIGPQGVRLYQPEQHTIPYSAIRSTSTLRRLFQLWYLGPDHKEELLEIKCDSNSTASGLYRALTERHDFYSCDTVRGAVTAQYIRDLKGTIASIFNESTPLGKKYVFDIRRTCREVHDGARRALYAAKVEAAAVAANSATSSCASADSSSADALAIIIDALTCRVCMDSAIDTVFFPCAHVLCCNDCAQKLRNCPLCRSEVDTAKKLYLPTQELGIQIPPM